MSTSARGMGCVEYYVIMRPLGSNKLQLLYVDLLWTEVMYP